MAKGSVESYDVYSLTQRSKLLPCNELSSEHSDSLGSMGIVKLALLSAAGYYSFRSVQRVTSLARAVSVPKGSALARLSSPSPQFSRYSDAYQARLPQAQAGEQPVQPLDT